MHNDIVFRKFPPQYTWRHHAVLTAVVAFHPNCNLQYRELWWEWGKAASTLQPYYLQNTKRIPGDCLEVDMENSESEYVQDGYSSVDNTVVVPGRNHKLFHGVFWAHYCVWSRTSIKGGVHTCWTCELCRLPFRAGLVHAAQTFIYAARMSPTLNGSSALQCFKCHNSIKLCKIFNFYPGLPHVRSVHCTW